MSTSLPTHHRALVLSSLSEPLQVVKKETPTPGPGSVVVRVILSGVLPYTGQVYSDDPSRPYPFPLPMTPGSSGVGRIAAIGPDTTAFEVGDLVLIDMFIVGRDNPSARFLCGLHSGATDGSRRLMEGEWRDFTYAEYAKVPLENCTKLNSVAPNPSDEQLNQLTTLGKFLVPYGGLLDINIQPGETVIIAPATGYFGGCAIEIALAMGARVVAAGRNQDALKGIETRLHNQRLRTVALTGDIEADSQALGPAEAFQDWSPPQAAKSTHLRACLMALKLNGRASLMGGIREDIPLPYQLVMRNNLKICGKWMYDQDAKAKMLLLLESGMLQLKPKNTKRFPLEQWAEAFEHAAANPGWESETLLAP